MNLAIVLRHLIKWNTENTQRETKFNTSLFTQINCLQFQAQLAKGCMGIECWNCPLVRRRYIDEYKNIPEPSNNPISDVYPILIYLLNRIPDE